MSKEISRSLHLRVLTPRRVLADAEAEEVSLPGLDGYLGILPGHRPLLIVLGRGAISYKRAGKEERIPVRGGYAEIHPEKVLVFTETGRPDESGEEVEG